MNSTPRFPLARLPLAWLLALALAATGALRAAEPPQPDPLAKMLKDADRLKSNRNEHGRVLRLCEEVIATPRATKDQKLQAFDTMAYAYAQKRSYADHIKLMDRLRALFPGDAAVDRKALLAQIGVYRTWKKPTEGLAAASELAEKHAADKPTVAAAHAHRAYFFYRARKYEDCYDAADKAVALDPENHEQVLAVLRLLSDAAWSKGHMERCLAASLRMLEPQLAALTPEHELPGRQKRPGECLVRLERHDDARDHFLKVEKATPDPRAAQEFCYLAARAALDGKHYDQALATFDRVFTSYPDRTDYWPHAQQGIVDAHRAAGRFPQAIAAARILLDAARDRGGVANYTRLIAELFRAIDNHLGRANQMINFQRFGPLGEDGKPGTPDDLKNPLAAIRYPDCSARDKALAKARKEAGDDAKAAHFRAVTYTYTGQPREALRHYLDAFARAHGSDYRSIGPEMIAVGARAVRGHPVGLEAFAEFVNHGPDGPDGKPGTPDDLKDPFAPLLK